MRAFHSSLKKLESLVLKLKLSLCTSWMNKSIDANWPSGGVHFDFRAVCVTRASFFVVTN